MAPITRSAEFGRYTLLICLFVSFGGFLFGYDSANIGGIVGMAQWLKRFGYPCAVGAASGASAIVDGQNYCISTNDKALVTSFLSLGTFVGAIAGYPIAEYLGRRGGLLVAAAVFCVGTAVQTGVSNVVGLTIGRVVAGLGVGLVSMMTPMYQAEAAPPRIRGALVSCYQLAITVGILVAQLVDFATANFRDESAFRIPIGLQVLFGLIFLIGCFFIPESPRYLVLKGRTDEAKASLARLRGQPVESEFVQAEFDDISGAYAHELSLGEASFKACFQGNMAKRTWAGILVQMFQQLTGVNFIFYYSTTYFQAADIDSPYLITVATGVVNVCMTLPGIYMVEKLGRRKFLFYGAVFMGLCQLSVGISAVAAPAAQASKTVLVVFTLLFIAGFASTWGPGAWVLIAELFPLKLRSRGMAMSTASNWFWNWVIAYIVPYITDAGQGNLGSKITFIWSATAFSAAIWTYFCVPETRGWSLEQLNEMFESNTPYRNTPSWTPALVAESVYEDKADKSDVVV